MKMIFIIWYDMMGEITMAYGMIYFIYFMFMFNIYWKISSARQFATQKFRQLSDQNEPMQMLVKNQRIIIIKLRIKCEIFNSNLNLHTFQLYLAFFSENKIML